MQKVFWNILKTAPVVLGSSLLVMDNSFAAPIEVQEQGSNSNQVLEQINQYNNPQLVSETNDAMDQVTSVDQLRDVSPSDWAYEALRSLVERYGCIAGYPNGTFRGNRSLTRYEFAAGLNSCLNQMERLIESSQAVLREDVDKLRKLVDEFQAELTALSARVDNLEGRTKFLEDHQFSTTTKLKGEVIFSLNGAFGDEKADGSVGSGPDVDSNITFSDRVRLNFDTSFNGKDRLRLRLEAGNVPNLSGATGTNMARLGYDDDNNNNIEVTDLYYRFPIGDKITAYVGATDLSLDDVFDVGNPYFESSGTGALSRFGRRNPLVYRGTDGTGAAINYKFSKGLDFTLAYLADGNNASNPAPEQGLFNGSYTAAAQLGFKPSDNISLGLIYAHSYQNANAVNLTGSTGSTFGNRPFGNIDTSADRFGVQANVKVSSNFNIGGWFGYAKAQDSANGIDVEADLMNWAVHLAFPDLGGKGNLAGVIVGMPPKVTDNDVATRKDPDTSFHIEALYRYKLSDKIAITPGVMVILNPNHNENNETVYVGTLRTTFSF